MNLAKVFPKHTLVKEFSAVKNINSFLLFIDIPE